MGSIRKFWPSRLFGGGRLTRIIHEGFYYNRRYAATTSLTAGGLATGLMLTLFAADNADKVERLGDSLVGVDCDPPTLGACQELADAAQAHDRQVRWARVSFAVGAVAGVSTIVYAVIASSDGRPAAAAAQAPAKPVFGVALERGGGRLLLDGRF